MSTLNKIDKIRNDIKLKIFQNKFQPGELISERKIASLYNVSRGTARKSLIDLQHHGLLSKIPSVGYKVNERKLDPILVENGFKGQLESVYGTDFYNDKLIQLDHKRSEASQDQYRIFGLKDKFIVDAFCSLRTTEDSKPKSLVTYYFPDLVLSSIKNTDINSLNTVLEGLHSQIKRIKAIIKFCKVNNDIVESLEINNSGEIMVQRICLFISNNDEVVYYTKELTNPSESVNVLPSNSIFRKVNGFLE